MNRHWIITRTVLLLFGSNVFMTTAWYGHLRFKHVAMWTVILAAWTLALPEYALQVPANRLGYGTLSGYQLKIIQECITLIVFIGFAWLVLGEPPHWRYLVSFLFIFAAVGFAFYK